MQNIYNKMNSFFYGLRLLQARCMKMNFQHVGGILQAIGAAYFLKLGLVKPSALKRLNLFFMLGKETLTLP